MTSKQQDREDLAWKIAESFGPDVCPIFTVRDCAEQTYFSEVAQTKRLLERYAMYALFHAACDADAQAACEACGIAIDAEAAGLLWDEATAADIRKAMEAGGPVPEMPLTVRRYQSFIAEKLAFRDWMRDAKSGVSGQFGLWRLQQMHRCTLELGANKNSDLVHATIAFELHKGFSVGCWFCGVGAEKLTGWFDYTPENAKLWQDTLDVCCDVIGASVFNGFCYLASDPLDNPDYAKFIEDFRDAYGRYPQPTTAIPLRNGEMTRRVLEMTSKDMGEIQRSLILTGRDLSGYHAFPELDACLKDGTLTAAQAALRVEAETGVALEQTLDALNELMRLGALDTEPTPADETDPATARTDAA